MSLSVDLLLLPFGMAHMNVIPCPPTLCAGEKKSNGSKTASEEEKGTRGQEEKEVESAE
jgi:hypothetical protein